MIAIAFLGLLVLTFAMTPLIIGRFVRHHRTVQREPLEGRPGLLGRKFVRLRCS